MCPNTHQNSRPGLHGRLQSTGTLLFNDLGGMFFTLEHAEEAKKFLPRKVDWPYLPVLQAPWYGQFH